MVVGCLTTCVKHKNWLWGSSYFQLPKTFNCLLSLLEWVQLRKFEFNSFTSSFWFFSNPPICFAAQVLTLLSQNVVFPNKNNVILLLLSKVFDILNNKAGCSTYGGRILNSFWSSLWLSWADFHNGLLGVWGNKINFKCRDSDEVFSLSAPV